MRDYIVYLLLKIGTQGSLTVSEVRGSKVEARARSHYKNTNAQGKAEKRTKMTRKNFIALAQIANNVKHSKLSIENTAYALQVELADYLATQNSRFNRDKFLDACNK